MRSFDSISVDSEIKNRVKYITQELNNSESELLFLYPPENNGGRRITKNLLNTAFYSYTEEESFFKRFNTSDVCGFEIWYENGEITFYWFVPGSQSDRYRRHLYNRYSNGELGSATDNFPDVGEKDYFAGSEYHLKHHYFEPVNHHDSPMEFSNIYEDLLSEIDTRDDSRVVIQVLFKPAEDDWTELHSMTVDDLADNLDMSSEQVSKWFGLVTKDRPLTSDEQNIPRMIRNQRDQKGYYVNYRIGVLGSDRDRVEMEMREIDNIIELTFEAASGQNFVPGRCSENQLQELMEDMAARRPRNMRQPKTPREYLQHKFTNSYEHIIMTADELSSIAHIPSSSDVDLDGIRWALITADGTLPSDAADFEEQTAEEREEILKELQSHSSTEMERRDAETDE